MDPLRQRELIITIIGIILTALGPKLGLTQEQVFAIGGMVSSYAISRGIAKTEVKTPTP